MSWVEFDEFEQLQKWTVAINRLPERYWMFTNFQKDKLLTGPFILILRPSVGGRMDSAYMKIDISMESVEKIMDSTLVRMFREANRLLHVKNFIIREDSFDASRVGD